VKPNFPPLKRNLEDVARRRLANTFLVGSDFTKAADVVRALGAVQAQDYGGAKWALSMRTRSALPDAEIERELDAGRIIRTHVLRPTWHFVSPKDLRWMLALTAPRVKAFLAYYDRKLELDAPVYRRSNAALTKALRDGKHLTRQELKPFLERSRIGSINGQRLGHLMMRAELDAIVCSGARRGKQFTYALVDERVPPTAVLDRDEALGKLARSYFETRGPATTNDFAWWSSLTTIDIRRGIEVAGKHVERLESGDRTYWRGRERRALPKKATAHLLPNYDEFFIAFKDRSAFGQRIGSARLVNGGDALIAYVVAVDGQLVGGWRRTASKGAVMVSLSLLSRLSAGEERLVAAEARKFGDFLALPVEMSRTNNVT
jgi:hypothetical protein